METPKVPHLLATKRIVRYVKRTLDYGILFSKGSDNLEVKLLGYYDSNQCGEKFDQKSIACYVFMCGKASISRCSKKESIMALSSCEAEYIPTSMSDCQAL